MSTTTASPQWKGRVLEGWDPEEAEYRGSQIAWKTLVTTASSLILGSVVWFLPNAIAPKLSDLGFELFKTQFHRLISMPGLSCAALYMVYMFLPVTIGTRRMIYWSSLLYVLPVIGWFFAVQNPNTSFALLLLLSFAYGIGAATFSGYMPSTSLFFPKCLQGTALDPQEGLDSLGMSVIQLSAPFLMSMNLFGVTWIAPKAAANPPVVINAVIFFIPWSLLAALLAFLFLKDIPVRANAKERLDTFSNPDTWYMTVLYIMVFGLFSGFDAQTALIINNDFDKLSPLTKSFNPDALLVGLFYASLSTLIGAVLRFAWGSLCGKFGGAIWTFISTIGMALTLSWCGWVLMTINDPFDFMPFLMGMLTMFLFADVGNVSTFKQMPMTMPKRQAGGAQGFTGVVAALSSSLVGIALTLMPAHIFCFVAAGYCVLCAVLYQTHYAHPGAPSPG